MSPAGHAAKPLRVSRLTDMDENFAIVHVAVYTRQLVSDHGLGASGSKLSR